MATVVAAGKAEDKKDDSAEEGGVREGNVNWKTWLSEGLTMDDAGDLVQHLSFNPTQAKSKKWIVFFETPIKP